MPERTAHGSQPEPIGFAGSASAAGASRRDRLPDQAETAAAQAAVRQGEYELVIEFPRDFAAAARAVSRAPDDGESAAAERAPLPVEVPSPAIFYNTAKDSSQIAYLRVNEILTRWTDADRPAKPEGKPGSAHRGQAVYVGRAGRGRGGAPQGGVVVENFAVRAAALGTDRRILSGRRPVRRRKRARHAGDPAQQSGRAARDRLGQAAHGHAVQHRHGAVESAQHGHYRLVRRPQLDFGPPPPLAIVWLLIALVPTSALFSGLCLALAAFARSTKEGQYYLMPLVLVTMPLTILPMSPGVELNLGNSLIPITGMVLLLRTCSRATMRQALPYVPLVVAVTLTCCLAGRALGRRPVQQRIGAVSRERAASTWACGCAGWFTTARTRPAWPRPFFAAC